MVAFTEGGLVSLFSQKSKYEHTLIRHPLQLRRARYPLLYRRIFPSPFVAQSVSSNSTGLALLALKRRHGFLTGQVQQSTPCAIQVRQAMLACHYTPPGLLYPPPREFRYFNILRSTPTCASAAASACLSGHKHGRDSRYI